MKSIISVHFARVCTTSALAVRSMYVQNGISATHEISNSSAHGRNSSVKMQENQQHCFSFILLLLYLMSPLGASCAERDWSMGVYGGKYFDTEPGNFANGNTTYLNQFIVAVTASKNVWRDETLPLSLEIDGMVGYQFGMAFLYEAAVAPVLRWSSFPWKKTLQTDFRFAPLGVSYTTIVSPMERGINGNGSKTLNFLLVELAFSLPEKQANEVFFRIHHRSTINDLINKYGANGEDFFTLGYRQFF